MLKYKGTPNITTIVLHHSAVSRATQPLQFDAVNNYHRTKDWGGGWKQTSPSELGFWVGYNFFCESTGKRTQTRLIGEETIANKGMNCDVPSRCTAISYCMAGNFAVEKPTQHQVNDFIAFIREVQEKYPEVVLKQHKDVQPGRTCAALTNDEIQKWILDPTVGETKDQQIARLTKERDAFQKQAKQLVALLTRLLEIINK